MKGHRRELWFEVPSRRGFVNITREVEEALAESGVREGLALLNADSTGEDNGDAHGKRQLLGREVVVAVTDGALDFGPWEQIF